MVVKAELITKAEMAKIQRENKLPVVAAGKLVLLTPEDENKAYTVLTTIKDRLKFIEERRTKITVPLNKSLREVNALFKDLSKPLKDADAVIRNKILEFRREQEEKAAKEEAKRRKLQESHKAKGHKVGAPAVVEAEVGRSTVQKRWTFEAVDYDKIPRKYLIPNKAAIDYAIRKGVRKIAGLRIYQKEILSVR